MAIIRTNKLLLILVPFVVLAVVAIILMSGGSSDAASVEAGNEKPLTLTPEELTLLGVEGDTPRDTVATLVGQVNALREQALSSQEESEKLRTLNEELARRNNAVDRQIEEAVQRGIESRKSNSGELGQQGRDLLSSLQSQVDQLNNRTGQSDIPIGLGLGDASGLVWVEPLDGKRSAERSLDGSVATTFPQTFSESNNPFSTESAAEFIAGLPATAAGDASTVEPVYTLPKNSTLMGSVAMTALLGRIPIDGVVSDPYPFKVMIGAENLTANGIDLPEVESAIVSGTASGDWTLSCVRGIVKSMTFVFYDGTIRTVPSEKEDQSEEDKSIGWLSDPQGLPCVYGERKTNAREFLLTSFILSAAGAASNAFALGETTSVVSATTGTTTSSLTGSAGKYAAGSAIASGVSDVREWVTERFGQTFDAIYVPPGQPVAIHIDTELAIDYETEGRRVRYDNAFMSRQLP